MGVKSRSEVAAAGSATTSCHPEPSTDTELGTLWLLGCTLLLPRVQDTSSWRDTAELQREPGDEEEGFDHIS